ncbi:MAG: lytic murein transglycosylase, partial [Actinomycetota bacterium]
MAGVVRSLGRLDGALRSSVSRWLRADPHVGARLPREVVLQALYQQRIFRALAADAGLARRVLAQLDGRPARTARRNVQAGSGLRSLVTPVKPNELFDTQRPAPPRLLLRYYRRAQGRFGVDWEVLAAINFVETRFGRVRSASVAGAQGPMQFIPSTWDTYGMGGDIQDPRDAIMAAANYLSASGAPTDYQ